MAQTGNKESLFREYYIVFSESDQLSGWFKWLFTRKGFEHCAVYMGFNGGTLVVNKTLNGVNLHYSNYNLHDMADAFAESGYKVVYLPRIYGRMSHKLGCYLPTCVSSCMQVTGLAFNAFTPYGYYKKLIKQGGIKVMGGSKPKVDHDAIRENKRLRNEAAEREKEERTKQAELKQRRKAGKKSLLGTKDDELGVS